MKLVFAVIAFCCLCNAYASKKWDIKAKLIAREDECLAETIGLTGHSIRKIDYSIRLTNLVPSNGSLDKFAICLLKKYRVLNGDGTVNKDVNKYHLISDNPKKKQHAMKCADSTGSSNEEIARKILMCFLNHDISMIYHGNRVPLYDPRYTRRFSFDRSPARAPTSEF